MNNLLSFSSLKLDSFSKKGTCLKPASGFVLEAGRRYYLLTNRHVVSSTEIHAAQEPSIEPYTLKTTIRVHVGEAEKSPLLFMGSRRE